MSTCVGVLYIILTLSTFSSLLFFFFFNDTATTEIYTLSLHDALPISDPAWAQQGLSSGARHLRRRRAFDRRVARGRAHRRARPHPGHRRRSEEHTSELQSHSDLVCRLLLEKKKKSLHWTCPLV